MLKVDSRLKSFVSELQSCLSTSLLSRTLVSPLLSGNCAFLFRSRDFTNRSSLKKKLNSRGFVIVVLVLFEMLNAASSCELHGGKRKI